MTIDDESSIYIGGLPYDASEDSLRRVFQFYGSVVAVKIINDRATRGKCYGFVTFTNPRSAIDAMEEMNGRTIGGRVIRVNKVRTRGGRSNFDGESFRDDFDSGRDWDRGWDRDRDRDRDRDQDRVRDYDHNRERYRDRSSDRLRDRDRTRDYDQERERRHEHVYNHDQARNGLFDRDQDQDRGLGVADLEHSRIRNPSWEREHVLDPDGDREMDRTNGHHDKLVEMDRDQNSRKWNGSNNTNQHGREYISNSNDQHGRDYPSNSNDDSDDQAEEQVQESMHRLDELKKEILQMEESLEEKGKLVLDLQQKSNKLEEALINAKKTSAYRKTQLAKLHRSFQQVQEYNERRKSCEKELQSLVDAAMLEEDINNDALWDGILANGNA